MWLGEAHVRDLESYIKLDDFILMQRGIRQLAILRGGTSGRRRTP